MLSSEVRTAVREGTAVVLGYVGNSVGLASSTNCLGFQGPQSPPRGIAPPNYLDAYLKTKNAASSVRNYSHGGATLKTINAGWIHHGGWNDFIIPSARTTIFHQEENNAL